MKEVPAYVIYFKDRSNCSRIESVKPGQDIPILVVPENALMAQPLRAIGSRSDNGENFKVTVHTPDGEDIHTWSYEWLKYDAIPLYKPEA